MSGSGGTLGPDLNAPRGITRYQKKSFLMSFIKKASSYRHTKMPDFDDLEPAELLRPHDLFRPHVQPRRNEIDYQARCPALVRLWA